MPIGYRDPLWSFKVEVSLLDCQNNQIWVQIVGNDQLLYNPSKKGKKGSIVVYLLGTFGFIKFWGFESK